MIVSFAATLISFMKLVSALENVVIELINLGVPSPARGRGADSGSSVTKAKDGDRFRQPNFIFSCEPRSGTHLELVMKPSWQKWLLASAIHALH